jgi:hypothetical protein
MNEKDKIIAMMLDTIREVNTCLAVTNHDRSNQRYKTEFNNHTNKYLTKNKEGNITFDNHLMQTDEKNNTFDMTDLKKSLQHEFDILEVVKLLSS